MRNKAKRVPLVAGARIKNKYGNWVVGIGLQTDWWWTSASTAYDAIIELKRLLDAASIWQDRKEQEDRFNG